VTDRTPNPRAFPAPSPPPRPPARGQTPCAPGRSGTSAGSARAGRGGRRAGTRRRAGAAASRSSRGGRRGARPAGARATRPQSSPVDALEAMHVLEDESGQAISLGRRRAGPGEHILHWTHQARERGTHLGRRRSGALPTPAPEHRPLDGRGFRHPERRGPVVPADVERSPPRGVRDRWGRWGGCHADRRHRHGHRRRSPALLHVPCVPLESQRTRRKRNAHIPQNPHLVPAGPSARTA
jgi:hypothetical protein